MAASWRRSRRNGVSMPASAKKHLTKQPQRREENGYGEG